jgi:hypothetical protein
MLPGFILLVDLMERFPIDKVIGLVGNLQAAAAAVTTNPYRDRSADLEWARQIAGHLDALRPECARCELKVSIEAIDELLDGLRRPSRYSASHFAGRLIELVRCVVHETRTRVILQLPTHSVDYFEKPALFGEAVVERLPDAIFDVEEAGNCFATMRYTAAVFHCMRVTEAALRALFGSLGLVLSHEKDRNWGNMLRQVREEIDLRDKASDVTWPAQRPFYVEACAHLSSVKDAWRNPVMHVESRYDMRGAERILHAVHSFAEYVAAGLTRA